jgi:hypothetical protein
MTLNLLPMVSASGSTPINAWFNASTILPVWGSGVLVAEAGLGVHIVAVRVWIAHVKASGPTLGVGGKHEINKITGKKGKKRFSI